jgi:hypothetical protein
MHVYLVTSKARAERIAIEGFRDNDYGALGRGVIVHLGPACVPDAGLALIAVHVRDDALRPFIDGEVACVPARILNAGDAELIDAAAGTNEPATTRNGRSTTRFVRDLSSSHMPNWPLNPVSPRRRN